ncbi:hypothetical protein CLU79DRAFT_696284 [Phycomyces nitens]|nr:hypothetical protein CLU79DRAFT_696284 [Phycomyces nitens]
MANRLLSKVSLIPKQAFLGRFQPRASSKLPIKPTCFVKFQNQAFATARPQSSPNGERTINIPRIPLLLIGIGFACLGVGLYEYFTSDIQKYPPPIRQALRKALYFSQDDRDTKLALQYFRQALELGIESPEMERDGAPLTGIMIQLGVLLETLGRLPEARQTLTLALRHLVGFENDRESKDKKPDSEIFNVDLSSLPTQTQKKVVGIAQKLGDIAAKCRLDDDAEKWYTWSVEHLLRISSRPKSEYNDTEEVIFDKDHMPAWLTKAELGGALEALGSFYAAHDKYVFAIQLYLQALNMAGLKTCHTAVLMNNLAEAYAAMGRFEEAKQWGQKGLDLSQNPNTRKQNDDGDKCDSACGTLLYNMGMLFEVGYHTNKTRLY